MEKNLCYVNCCRFDLGSTSSPSVGSSDLPDQFQSTTISFSILDDVDTRHHIQPVISLPSRGDS